MKYDVVLAFGDEIKNGRLAEQGVQRLDAAIKIYKKKEVGKIVTSAGSSPRFNKTKKSLAQHAKDYLIAREIPENDIIMQELPMNTLTEIMGLREIMRREGWQSAILLSSDWHIWRIKTFAKAVLKNKYKLKFVALATKRELWRARELEMRSLTSGYEWLDYLEKMGWYKVD